MESRIKELRENRRLIQAILASELNITQQSLSKYERDITTIKIDILKSSILPYSSYAARNATFSTKPPNRSLNCDFGSDTAGLTI